MASGTKNFECPPRQPGEHSRLTKIASVGNINATTDINNGIADRRDSVTAGNANQQ